MTWYMTKHANTTSDLLQRSKYLLNVLFVFCPVTFRKCSFTVKCIWDQKSQLQAQNLVPTTQIHKGKVYGVKLLKQT